MTRDRFPSAEEIHADPQLAILTTLDVTIELAAQALSVIYPQLFDDDNIRFASRTARCARRLVDLASKVQRDLDCYRHALRKERRAALRDEDIPF